MFGPFLAYILENARIMKTIALFAFAVLTLASCVEYEARPVYDERNALVGYYDVEEYSRTYREHITYEIFVTKNPRHSREIFLNDFYALDTEVVALVDYGHITIPLQVSNGYEIEGSGDVYGRELHLSYRVRDLHDNSYADYCEAVAYLY